MKTMVIHDMVSSDQIDKCLMLLCSMRANVVVGGPPWMEALSLMQSREKTPSHDRFVVGAHINNPFILF